MGFSQSLIVEVSISYCAVNFPLKYHDVNSPKFSTFLSEVYDLSYKISTQSLVTRILVLPDVSFPKKLIFVLLVVHP